MLENDFVSIEGEEDGSGSAPDLFNPEALLAQLKHVGLEAASKKRGPIAKEDVQKLARHLQIRGHSTNSKEALVAAIFARLKKEENLDRVVATQGSFKKDKNTVPRIINISLKYYSELVNLELIASRTQLQAGEVYGNNSFFKKIADEFNDRTLNSGGLAGWHDVFEQDGIDPERVGDQTITQELVWKYFRSCLSEYKRSMTNYFASGLHDSRDFWPFCFGKTDLLYMHIAVHATGKQDVIDFIAKGGELANGGVDTGTSSNAASSSSAAPAAVEDHQPSEQAKSASTATYAERQDRKRKREAQAVGEITAALRNINESNMNSFESRTVSCGQLSLSVLAWEEVLRNNRADLRVLLASGVDPDNEEVLELKSNIEEAKKYCAKFKEELNKLKFS